MNFPWSNFKNFIDTVDGKLVEIVRDDHYYLYYVLPNLTITSVFSDSSSDATDYEANYQANANQKLADTDADQVVRVKYAETGHAYLPDFFQVTTSTLNSETHKQVNIDTKVEESAGLVSLKFYDASGTELTTQGDLDSSCTLTYATFSPTMDYEAISGIIMQKDLPAQAVCLDSYGGGVNSPGSPFPNPSALTKMFCRNLDLRFLGDHVVFKTDGRASKKMTKDNVALPGVKLNEFGLFFRHPAGFKHDIQIAIEYFRA